MRSTSSGTISLGFVSIPVQMFTATESKKPEAYVLHREDVTTTGSDLVYEAA